MDFQKGAMLVLVGFILSLSLTNLYTVTELTGMATSGITSLCVILAPNISMIPDQQANIGSLFTYDINEGSACGEIVTFSSLVIPGLSSFDINSSTGLISFVPGSGDSGTYEVYIFASKPGYSSDSEQFQLTISGSLAPENLTCSKFGHNVSFSWDEVSGASNYTVYYSTNVSRIMSLNVSASLPSQVINVTNLTSTNWNDTDAFDDQKRYYTVSAWRSGVETLTNDLPCGKFTYNYTVPSSDVYGPLASNFVSLHLNISYTAESFLQEIPGGLNPTLSVLLKSNASDEYWKTHSRGAESNNFDLDRSVGYLLGLDSNYNHTVVGKVYNAPYVLEYDVPEFRVGEVLASNFRGIYDFNNSYYAEDFLQEIPGSLNPTITRQLKNNASGEYWQTHSRGAESNNFLLILGTGYLVALDDNYNHTLCTGCFN